ncbi:MAG TPA: GAF domain-containing protein, partial [Acidimicrobiia bacterium]|nr:GAF domain-containing protein [Acidimicrobiia bacterium]
MSELVASRLTFRDAVPALLSTLVATVGWPVAVLWMVDPTRGRLRCTEVVTARSGMAKRFERRCRTVSFKEGDGIPGRAWRSRVPVLVDRHVDDRRWDDA